MIGFLISQSRGMILRAISEFSESFQSIQRKIRLRYMRSPKWSTKFLVNDKNPGSKPLEMVPQYLETPWSAKSTEVLRQPPVKLETCVPPQIFQVNDHIVPDFKHKEKWLQMLSNGTPTHYLSVLHRMIQAEDTLGIFGYPVTDDIAPQYSHYVKKPMDFATMQSKIKHYTSFSEYYVRRLLYILSGNDPYDKFLGGLDPGF